VRVGSRMASCKEGSLFWRADPAGDQPIGWLYEEKGRSPVGALALDELGRQPNLAIVVKDSLELHSPHRLRDLPSPLRFMSLKLWALLPVANVKGASAALAKWGVLGAIREQNVVARQASHAERRARDG
jgi:hypothetical protein